MNLVLLFYLMMTMNCQKSHAQFSDSLPQMPGWPKDLSCQMSVGVTLADINQDGFLEILVGTYDATYDTCEFHVWDYQGNELPGWPKVIRQYDILGKPAVADLDPSYPGLEIIVSDFNCRIYAWHSDGTDVTGWPYNAGMTSPYCSPAISDIDHDGDLEVVYNSQNGVHVISHDGTPCPGWPVWTSSGYRTPSIADVDQDGNVDICILVHHALYLYDIYGNVKPGWPINFEEWYSGSSCQPVLADLDNDNDLEILMAFYIPDPPNSKIYVAIYHHDATSFENWPQEFPGPMTFVTPAVGDIDNDGDLEICGGGNVVEPWPGFMFRHHTGDTVQGWPQAVDALSCTPIIFDLDLSNNGKREIVINTNSNMVDQFLAFHDDGTNVDGWPQTTGCAAPNAAAVGDVDNDGDIEIAIVAGDGTKRYPVRVYLFTVEGVEYRPYMTEWGSWFHDNWNTGWFHPKAPDNVNATSTPDWIRLTWDTNTEPDIAGYHVYRALISGGPYTKLTDTLLTQTMYYDIPPDTTTYYYCVTARIQAETESRLSDEVSGHLGIANRNVDVFPFISAGPTPFTQAITFHVPEDESATVTIYKCDGSIVDKLTGRGAIKWQPSKDISAGIYFVKLKTDKGIFEYKIVRIQ